MNGLALCSKSWRKSFGALVSIALLVFVFLYAKPEGLQSYISSFSYWLLFFVFLLLIANILVVVYRYYRILNHFGFAPGWWPVLKGCILGNIASLVVIPLMGQMAGRQAVLRAAGVSAVENAAIVAYERVLVGVTSAVLAAAGGAYLLGSQMGGFLADMPVWQMVGVIIAACALSLYLGISAFERSMIRILFTTVNFYRVVELVIMTLFSLMLMLSCFALLFGAIMPSGNALELFSIAAIVSFAAGLPISFGGWGLREITAVYMLGLFGVASGEALAASILCGVLSILSVLVFGPLLWLDRERGGVSIISRSNQRMHNPAVPAGDLPVEHIAAWVLCFVVALLILFQVHVSLGDVVINVNLADPFAVLALSVVALEAVFHRRLPVWQVEHFNWALLILSLVMLLGFAHGWYVIGANGWAAGKLLGWFVLCGYMAAGYLSLAYCRERGFQRIVETMMAAMCLIVLLRIVLIVLEQYGVLSTKGSPMGFEGYAGNRNALAFQILAVSAAFLAFLPVYARQRLTVASPVSRSGIAAVALGLMVTGMILTASRAGMTAMCALFLLAAVFRVADRRSILKAAMYGVAVWAVLIYHPAILAYLMPSSLLDGIGNEQVQPRFSTDESDASRWLLMQKSVEMWFQAPLFGKGLGYFLDTSASFMGFPIIIHNTAVWILAEFGLIGFLPFAVTFFMMTRWALRRGANRVQANAALLLLVCFALMSVFHEVLYQRIFWFIIGAALASKYARAGLRAA